MKIGFWRLSSPCFDIEGGGPGAPAGGGAPAGTPAGTPPAGSGGNPGAPASGAPSSGSAPAGTLPASTQFTYAEDRSNWVPSHVVRQRTERAAQLERDLEHARSQVAALSGVTRPAAPPNPEVQAIRDQLLQVIPELKDILDNREHITGLKDLNLKDTIEQLRNAQQQGHVQRGTQTLNALATEVRNVYGAAGKDLSEKAIQRIQRAFISELQHDEELAGRYESGDPDVVSDFVKDFTGGVLDPYRRSIAANPQTPGQFAARRLPRGGGGTPVAGATPARTVKPSDGEDFHKSAFTRFMQG